MTFIEVVISILLIIGVTIRMLASIGLLRFGDVYMRMHSATKGSTLAVLFILAASVLFFGDSLIAIKLIALSFIYFFTAPTGSQVLAHASHVAGVPKVKETWIDELPDDENARALD